MREVKQPEVRKAEIVESAKNLFLQKGYLHVTTQDIVDDLRISRGLLYYHFKSKEDILKYIIEAETLKTEIQLKKITYSKALSAVEKVNQFIEATIIPVSADTQENRALQETIRLQENTYMTDQIYRRMTESMAHYFCDILEQGNKEGIFYVSNPKETSVFLMNAYLFTLNSRDFHVSDTQMAHKYMSVFHDILGKVIQSKNNIFDL
jgi:AcrR family transcriptional regulator